MKHAVDPVVDTAFTGVEDQLGITAACRLTGRSRTTHYRLLKPPAARTPCSHPQAQAQPSALTAEERAAVLELMNSAEYAELPPAQIWDRELDAGRYHCSVSTSMTSKKVSQLLIDLGVTRSHSRPQSPTTSRTGERGNHTPGKLGWTTSTPARKTAAPGASCCSVGFDTLELCGRPRSHVRPARRSPDRDDDLELMLTRVDRATASYVKVLYTKGLEAAWFQVCECSGLRIVREVLTLFTGSLSSNCSTLRPLFDISDNEDRTTPLPDSP
jgi:hypothetical protein